MTWVSLGGGARDNVIPRVGSRSGVIAGWPTQCAVHRRADAIADRAAVRASVVTHPMTKFVIAFIVVAAVLISGLTSLLRNWRQPLAPPDVLERAKQRNRELEEEERREREG